VPDVVVLGTDKRLWLEHPPFGNVNGLRFIGLDLEARMGADEHVHQRAFANAQAKSITTSPPRSAVTGVLNR
jgi:hypothetical protein